jgi:hypothetical protein
VLDFMDEHDMWSDTMLLVNTDHGFLLGEHGWWAKSVQPWFNELVHLPMFLWDPRTAGRDTRRGALAQTIDIAPTLLRFFGQEPTPDMQGTDLAVVLQDDQEVRAGALFGIHGGHVNVTDGRFVYMRAAADPNNGPLEDYTLMPTHMRSRFTVGELQNWEPAEPFTFTKGLRTMRIDGVSSFLNPWQHGSLLFDLETDPHQERPLVDDDVELRMLRLLAALLRSSDAPATQYHRLGIPATGEPGPQHLLVKTQADRAADTAAPLAPITNPEAAQLLSSPIQQLLLDPAARSIVERHVPGLVQTELVSLPAELSLLGLARVGAITAAALAALADDFSPALAH